MFCRRSRRCYSSNQLDPKDLVSFELWLLKKTYLSNFELLSKNALLYRYLPLKKKHRNKHCSPMTRLRALLCLLSWGSSGTSALLSSRNRVSSRHVPSPPLPQLQQQQQQLCLQQSSPVRREGVVLSATVVERGLELEVGDTFFRRESQLSRDMSVLAAHLHREAIAAEVTTAQATAVETAAAATTRKDDSENGSSSGSGSDPDSDTASSSASNSAPSSASSSSSASGASYSFKVVDAYSGVGSRAARYLHQAGATAVLANDANEDTHPFLLKNLATTTTATSSSSSSSSSSSRRGSGNVTVTHMDAQRLLLRLWQEKDFQDVVDCDSFGESLLLPLTIRPHSQSSRTLLSAANLPDGRTN